MFLTYLILAVALSLSGIAAFYSIAGLTAIFASAVVPIVVMGSILEIAKLAVTVWLHEYWHHVRWTMKAYLVPAVVLLMVITSMGIFGFLSKAHLDQSVPTGDVAAQVELIDEKIRTQRDNITTAKTALQQMDSQVNERLSRSSDDRGAERAVQIRRQQQSERAKLQKEIADAQAVIAKLNEQRAPVASELRKVEAEVGPIKYIAALIYGDNPDVNVLEKAVRWVIIILVVVFDPLAVMMLLAFTESLRWEQQRRAQQTSTMTPDTTPPTEDLLGAKEPEQMSVPDAEPELTHQYLYKPWRHIPSGPEPMPELIETVDSQDPALELVETTESHPATTPELIETVDSQDPASDSPAPLQEADDDDIDDHDARVKEAMRIWKQANPGKTLKDQRHRYEQGLIDQLPWMSLLDELPERTPSTGFGTQFPNTAGKGDAWIRTDQAPNVLYRFNGSEWIEISKQISDSYTHDDAYIDYLIEKIDTGEYDPEFLTSAEAEQIAQRLDKTRQ
jgi:hypothetical protein